VIIDGLTALDWILNTGYVDPSRVLLVSQSLGTAVAMGVATAYAEDHPDAPLAGIVIVAGFTSLRKLLGGYRMAGVLPLFGPFTPFPRFLDFFLRKCLRAEFDTEARLVRLRELTRGKRFTITLVHALNDWEISSKQSRRLFEVAVGGEISGVVETVMSDCVEKRNEEGDVRFFEGVWGGHNDIQKSDVVVRAVKGAWKGPKMVRDERGEDSLIN
jgi:abhydrolase domain-containing protein 12